MVVGAPTEGRDSAGAAYVYVRNASGWTLQAYLRASNPDSYDGFGTAVGIDGDTIVVGAPNEASRAIGVNGDQTDNSVNTRGAVYVFVRSGANWTQQAYLKTNNDHQLARFGFSVAVSGNFVVAGAVSESIAAHDGTGHGPTLTDAGAAYVFKRTGTEWAQHDSLRASNAGVLDEFGRSVAISGGRIVVGAADEASDARTIDGDGSNDNAYASGAAYVFDRKGSKWVQTAYLKASDAEAEDQFGFSVAVWNDTVVVGAPTKIVAPQESFSFEEAEPSRPGAAYVFGLEGTNWVQEAILTADLQGANDNFGTSVGISHGLVLVGANQEDSQAVMIDGDSENDEAPDAGAAYIFAKRGRGWSQLAYIKASNTDAGDQFGTAVAISRNTIVVGAPFEASAATEINGNGADNCRPLAGAAYTFTIPLPRLNSESLDVDRRRPRLSFESSFETDFSVLATSDLTGEWTVLGKAHKGESGLYEFNDSTAGSVSSRFYRLRME